MVFLTFLIYKIFDFDFLKLKWKNFLKNYPNLSLSQEILRICSKH